MKNHLLTSTFLAVGTTAVSAAALDLQGSDRLAEMTRTILQTCNLASIGYAVSASNGAEAALLDGVDARADVEGKAVVAVTPWLQRGAELPGAAAVHAEGTSRAGKRAAAREIRRVRRSAVTPIAAAIRPSAPTAPPRAGNACSAHPFDVVLGSASVLGDAH
jgi:hypothetical protein